MHQTPLNAFHREHGGRLVEFAGWEMPVVYRGIIEEHVYTREHCTVFDVSHMGRLEVSGERAADFLERLCTRRIADAKVGQSRYSHVCKEDGGILDDVIVSRLADHFLVVCNASNREKILAWFRRHTREFGVQINDRTFETAMVAIQGPEAMETVGQLLPLPLGDLKRYHFQTGNVMGAEYFAARSGYTGEDGVEIIIPAHLAHVAAQMLVSQSAELGRPIKPGGLGARDTLRLEAAMPLYGHELTEDWDSITAGQAWCVDLTKEFIGQPVMRRVKEQGPVRTIVGWELEGKRIARQGAAIFHNGRQVGLVTSGTQSPTFNKVLGMGLMESAAAKPGTPIEIDVRGARASGKVVPLPFYKRQAQ